MLALGTIAIMARLHALAYGIKAAILKLDGQRE